MLESSRCMTGRGQQTGSRQNGRCRWAVFFIFWYSLTLKNIFIFRSSFCSLQWLSIWFLFWCFLVYMTLYWRSWQGCHFFGTTCIVNHKLFFPDTVCITAAPAAATSTTAGVFWMCRYNEGLVDIVASSVQMLGEPRRVFPSRTLSLSSPVLWV